MQTTDYQSYQHWWNQHGRRAIDRFTTGHTTYIYGLAPQRALELTGIELMEILHARLGAATIREAMDPARPYPSPLTGTPDTDWLRDCNTVGINLRTIGSAWNVLKYALTLPAHVRGVHLLPIWEPGVVGSLYGMASWELNPEFLDFEALRMFPQLRTVENQLAVVVNLLHALGKVVGMDVIPHTDRYSEMALANPRFFEWLRREELTIADHREDLHEEVEAAILDWLAERPDGQAAPYERSDFFYARDDAFRRARLFGRPADYDRRRDRRVSLVDYLYRRGLEPVPATMAPPYRGLEVDPRPEAVTVDTAGRTWRDYRMTEPQEMSRVFGPLARYKFYGREDDNRNWAIDFERPRPEVWEYFTAHYAAIQRRYNFDFMRGDMSHVQMRSEGVPEHPGEFYDPLRAVKERIQRAVPYFGYFAESFLTPPNFMAYGDEVEHLEASRAEVTLGNLQSTVPASGEFCLDFGRYLEIQRNTPVTPAWTVITGDKDDPRFDHFHHHGEVARMFCGLFLGRLPLYYSLGFAQRDRHFEPWANEFYTKLYVFVEEAGPKSVAGPWRWGYNLELFRQLDRLHRLAERLLPHLARRPNGGGAGYPVYPFEYRAGGPAAALGGELGAVAGAAGVPEGVVWWLRGASDGEGEYLFVVNFRSEPLESLTLAVPSRGPGADLVYASDEIGHEALGIRDGRVRLSLPGGAARVYRIGMARG